MQDPFKYSYVHHKEKVNINNVPNYRQGDLRAFGLSSI